MSFLINYHLLLIFLNIKRINILLKFSNNILQILFIVDQLLPLLIFFPELISVDGAQLLKLFLNFFLLCNLRCEFVVAPQIGHQNQDYNLQCQQMHQK